MNGSDQMDLVFHALASDARRRLMDLVKQMPGCSVNDLCEHFETSRIAVMKHLKVLVEAQLIISRKQGRTRQLFFNVAPIQMIFDRWSEEYSAFWASQVVDLKYQVESASLARARAPRPANQRKQKKKSSRTKRKSKS